MCTGIEAEDTARGHSSNQSNLVFLDLGQSVDEMQATPTDVSVGLAWPSLVPRLLFTEWENSLVNCLYRFGSKILKSL